MHATIADEWLSWRVDLVRTVGGADSGAFSFYRVNAALVDVDSLGRIYVLDQTARRVVVLDSSSALLRTMGREGGGPGELLAPLSVSVTPGGQVLVHDASKGSIVRFDPDGEPLAEIPFTSATINIRLRHVDVSGEAIVAWSRETFTGSDHRDERLIALVGGDTVELLSAESVRTSTATYPACGMAFTKPVPLSPFIHWAGWGDRVAVAVWGEDRVDVFDDLRRTLSIRLGPARSEIDEADAVRRLETMGYVGPCNASPREVVRKHGFHPMPQRIRGVAVGPDGSLWIARLTPDGERVVVLFDSTGVPRGLLPPSVQLPVAFLPDGRVLVSFRDSLGVETLGTVTVQEWDAPAEGG